MPEVRYWRLDLASGGLLLAGLLVVLAVCSHDPADLPGPVYPTNPQPHNLLGPVGADLSAGLLVALGSATPVLLGGWFVLVLLLLLRRRWFLWSLRFLGWLLLVPCSAVLAELWGLPGPSSAVCGPGGSIGAWLTQWLETSFEPLARALILGGTVLVAFSLSFDFVVLRLGQLARQLANALLPIRSNRAGTRGRLLAGRTALADLDPLVTIAEEEDPIRGSKTDIHTIPIHHHDAVPALPHPNLDVLKTSSAGPVPQSEQERFAGFELPPLTGLEDAQPLPLGSQDEELRNRAALLEKTFTDFGLKVKVVGINTGPVLTQFELALETGLRVHKVMRLSDDIALNLKALSVRISPIPGKNTVGIEVPNELRADVRLKEVMLASTRKAAKCKLPLFLGKDAEGRPLVHDLADMPHLLIAGTTGTGKSVCINALLLSILMTRRPDEVKLILVDPKIVEMEMYAKLPHLMHPVVSDMKKTEAILGWAVDKMEERYDLLRRARVRNIAGYNDLAAGEARKRVQPDEAEAPHFQERLPYIIIVIDEMADLMMQMRKEVEGHVIRLAQKSRAAGIHLVIATQKPTVDIITGLIKSNLPSRICFKVANKSDSRVVLDVMGADKLLGKGDLLFLPPGTSNLIRGQGTYASDAEIQAVVGFLETDEPCYAAELMQLQTRDGEGTGGNLAQRLKARDELYEQAVEIVIREGRGSTSLLQRALGIGYGKASRFIDFMAEDGIVGGYNGSSAREVLYTAEQWAEMRQGGSGFQR
jgi:S-DNA-T family DNA segregation ATPase FtsK/SpoIIIE